MGLHCRYVGKNLSTKIYPLYERLHSRFGVCSLFAYILEQKVKRFAYVLKQKVSAFAYVLKQISIFVSENQFV